MSFRITAPQSYRNRRLSSHRKRDNVIVISTYGRGVWVFDAAAIRP